MKKKDKNTLMAERKNEKTKREKDRKEKKSESETRLMLLQEAVDFEVMVELENGELYKGVIKEEGKKIFSIGDAKEGNVSELNRISFSSDQVRSVEFLGRPEIQEIMEYLIQYKEQSTKGGEMILVKCEDIIVKLKETEALRMLLLKNMKEADKGENPVYCLHGITKNNLCMVMKFCKGDITRQTLDMVIEKYVQPSSRENDFRIHLFNFIQAAHYFKIKSLMDFTCEQLRNEVRTLWDQVAIQIKTRGLPTYLPESHSVRAPPPEVTVPVIARRGPNEVSKKLRSHGRETYIVPLDSEDVHGSPFAANMLFFFKEKSKIDACVEVLKIIRARMTEDCMEHSYWEKLDNSMEHFKCLINGEPRLAEHLSADDAHSLVQIVGHVGNIAIKLSCISILSQAHFDKFRNVIEGEALPLFVTLMNSDYPQLVEEVLIALSRLVYAYPDNFQVILKEGALEAAQNIFKKNACTLAVIKNFANFMAAVCRGVNLSSGELSNDKVNKILTILKELWKKKLETSCHIVRTCNALSYLSYERSVPIEAAELKRLTELFIDDDISIAGAALGVVANIARWGSGKQIRLLAEDPKLLQGLGSKWLVCEFKIFQKGACQIISNMAAQSETFRENMLSLTNPLLDLLFKKNRENKENEDEFDVPMEAAWSFLNSSYEYDENMIDEYNYDNQAAAVLHLKNKRTYTKLLSVARTFDP